MDAREEEDEEEDDSEDERSMLSVIGWIDDGVRAIAGTSLEHIESRMAKRMAPVRSQIKCLTVRSTAIYSNGHLEHQRVESPLGLYLTVHLSYAHCVVLVVGVLIRPFSPWLNRIESSVGGELSQFQVGVDE